MTFLNQEMLFLENTTYVFQFADAESTQAHSHDPAPVRFFCKVLWWILIRVNLHLTTHILTDATANIKKKVKN